MNELIWFAINKISFFIANCIFSIMQKATTRKTSSKTTPTEAKMRMVQELRHCLISKQSFAAYIRQKCTLQALGCSEPPFWPGAHVGWGSWPPFGHATCRVGGNPECVSVCMWCWCVVLRCCFDVVKMVYWLCGFIVFFIVVSSLFNMIVFGLLLVIVELLICFWSVHFVIFVVCWLCVDRVCKYLCK